MKQRKLQLNNNWAKHKAAQLNTWMQGSVKARSAVCTATAIACLVGMAAATIGYVGGTKSAATKEVAQSMAADNKDYEKLIKKYNSLVDEYKRCAHGYEVRMDGV